MTELLLSPPHAGRYGGQRRSPGAMAAAIALNGGVFALLVALPATQYVIDAVPDTPTHWVPLDRDPPENPPEPTEARKPLQKATEAQAPETKAFVQPDTSFTTDNRITGTTVIDTDIATVIRDPVVIEPPHKPLFRAATRDPRYAEGFRPDYPPSLRRMGLEGSATVRVTIDERGRVIAVEMVKATDPVFFEETRSQALRHWRFRPATSDGLPVQSQQVLTVQFRLDDDW